MHDNHTQYLAVGGYNSTNEHHKFVKEENIYSRNAIQIWRVTSNTEEDTPPVLDMCLLHDFGIVINFKWCPFSVHDEGEKLGILAVLFGDGEVRLLVVPHPHLVRDQENISLQETIYRKLVPKFILKFSTLTPLFCILVKVEAPRLVLKLPRMYNLCFSWGGGYRKLACGTKSGNIVVWDILQSLLQTTPIVNINIPNASLLAIKCISWISLFDESLLISSDSDGNINLHDLKDPFLSSKIFRVRCKVFVCMKFQAEGKKINLVSGTYICILGTGHGKEFLFGDIDGITRKNTAFSNKKSVTLTMHNSLIWSIAASPFHGIVASAGSDGSVMVKPFSSDKYALNPKHKVKSRGYNHQSLCALICSV
jgi:WD40 repeat protein